MGECVCIGGGGEGEGQDAANATCFLALMDELSLDLQPQLTLTLDQRCFLGE